MKAEAEAKAVEEAVKKSEVVPELTPEQQKIQYEKPVEKQWVSFTALLSTEDAFALKGFFESRNITFKPI